MGLYVRIEMKWIILLITMERAQIIFSIKGGDDETSNLPEMQQTIYMERS